MESVNPISLLRELEGSGYEIVDGQPNILGWPVKDTNGRKLGVVEDLLFDPELGKVRYLITNLRNNDFDFDRKSVLIPIGIAEIHERHDDIILPTAAVWQVRALPAYKKGALTQYDEQDIYQIFSSISPNATGAVAFPGAVNFYESSQFNTDHFYRNRSKDNLNSDLSQPKVRVRTLGKQPADRQQHAFADTSAIRSGELGDNDSIDDRLKRVERELEELRRELRLLQGRETGTLSGR